MGLECGGMVTAEGMSSAMPLQRASGAGRRGRLLDRQGHSRVGRAGSLGRACARWTGSMALVIPSGLAWRHFMGRVTETSQKRQTPHRRGEILL